VYKRQGETLTTAELQGLTYKTVENAYGTGNVTWTVADNGSATGNTLSQSLSVTVTAVNDAPLATGTLSAVMPKGGVHILTTSELYFSDPDNISTEETFTVSSTTNGQVLVNGNVATSFTAAQVAAGNVSFIHSGNATAASFTVQLEDGNQDLSAPASTLMSFDVQDVTVTLSSSSDTNFVGDLVTNDTTPTLLVAVPGGAALGAVVKIYEGSSTTAFVSRTIVSSDIDSNGNVMVTLPVTSSGAHSYYASYVVMGVETAQSPVLSPLFIDITAPAAAAQVLTTQLSDGYLNAAETTLGLSMTGRAEPNSQVILTITGAGSTAVVSSVNTSPSGVWSFTGTNAVTGLGVF
jgi:hypothetical protein